MENLWNQPQYGRVDGESPETSNDDIGENTEQTEIAKEIETVTPGKDNGEPGAGEHDGYLRDEQTLDALSPDPEDFDESNDDYDTPDDDDLSDTADDDDELIPITEDDGEDGDDDEGSSARRVTTDTLNNGDFSPPSTGRTSGRMIDHEPGLSGPEGGRQ